MHAPAITVLCVTVIWAAWDFSPDWSGPGLFSSEVFPQILLVCSFLVISVFLLEGFVRYRRYPSDRRQRVRRPISPVHGTSKRPAWLQLHLSTCIVLMFVSGLIIGANIRGDGALAAGLKGPSSNVGVTWVKYGWPILFYSNLRSPRTNHFYKAPTAIAENVAVALLLLAGSAVCLELVLRRREARAEAQGQGTLPSR